MCWRDSILLCLTRNGEIYILNDRITGWLKLSERVKLMLFSVFENLHTLEDESCREWRESIK